MRNYPIAVREDPVSVMEAFDRGFAGMGTIRIKDEGKRVVVAATIPGATKKNTTVRVRNGMVTFEMADSRREEKRDRDFYYAASSYSAVTRSVPVPEGVVAGRAAVRFVRDGVEVRFPKQR